MYRSRVELRIRNEVKPQWFWRSAQKSQHDILASWKKYPRRCSYLGSLYFSVHYEEREEEISRNYRVSTAFAKSRHFIFNVIKWSSPKTKQKCIQETLLQKVIKLASKLFAYTNLETLNILIMSIFGLSTWFKTYYIWFQRFSKGKLSRHSSLFRFPVVRGFLFRNTDYIHITNVVWSSNESTKQSGRTPVAKCEIQVGYSKINSFICIDR